MTATKVVNLTKDENDCYHSFNGEPALETNKGTKVWYHHGQISNTEGPACIWDDNSKEWWINGVDVTERVTNWCSENGHDPENMTDVDIQFMWLSLGLHYDDKKQPLFKD